MYLDSALDMGSHRILGCALGVHHNLALATERWPGRSPSEATLLPASLRAAQIAQLMGRRARHGQRGHQVPGTRP
jgi:hypothetical protein